MAVELCKVNLWLEALEPGKPLSFLEHHIQCGNSLLGTTPALLRSGIPDEAFEPIEGDDKKVASILKRRNKGESEGQTALFASFVAEPEPSYGGLGERVAQLDDIDDSTTSGLHEKEERWHQITDSSAFKRARLLADAWSASFVWHKVKGAPEAVTNDVFRRLMDNPTQVAPEIRVEIAQIAKRYAFFHWHVAFPHVFRVPGAAEEVLWDGPGWIGGFDVVLGNPPWERVKLQEKEFFASRAPEIAAAANAAARKKGIARLEAENPELWAEWHEALRRTDGELSSVRNSGRYPLCGRGDVNTYSIFAELNRSLPGETGRAGCIVPIGIATDSTTQLFFKDLIETRSLACLYGFENEGKLFSGVDHRVNFCVLVVRRTPTLTGAEFAAFLRHPSVLREEDRRYRLNATDIALLNPNTRTCPVFRTRRDAELTKTIYHRVPVFWREGDPDGNPWGASFRSMFHMSGDSGLFRTREELAADGWKLEGNVFVRNGARMLPLYEAKMVYHFDHRFGDFSLLEPGDRSHILPTPARDLLGRPDYVPLPRYWVVEEEVTRRMDDWWSKRWFVGWRDVTDPRSSVRTVVSCVIPRTAVSGKFPLVLTREGPTWFVCAIFSSFVCDYVGRQKIGGVSLSMFVMKQLPILPPSAAAAWCTWLSGCEHVTAFIRPRVLELTYTAWDLQGFAQDLNWDGPPFRWDAERRFKLRCELDAAFFHLYGIARADVDYIMETFPIVRRNDEKQYGAYRTKELILDIYDRMAKAMQGGEPYQTILDPPPADPRLAHPSRNSNT